MSFEHYLGLAESISALLVGLIEFERDFESPSDLVQKASENIAML